PGDGERHEVRVHRIHFSHDGWPVLSPHRYGGEPAAETARPGLHRRQLEARWQLVDHGRAVSPEVVDSQTIALHRNGQISRAVTVLEDLRYDGVVALGRHEELGTWTPTFSVLGPDGRALWGSREV